MIGSQKPMMLQSALAFEQIIKVKEFLSLCLFNFNGVCAYSVPLFLRLLHCNLKNYFLINRWSWLAIINVTFLVLICTEQRCPLIFKCLLMFVEQKSQHQLPISNSVRSLPVFLLQCTDVAITLCPSMSVICQIILSLVQLGKGRNKTIFLILSLYLC